MEIFDAAKEKKEKVWFWGFYFVSELADKEQTKNKNWNYTLPFDVINNCLKMSDANQMHWS